MKKDDDSRRTKKRTQKNGIRNLARTTNENSISIKASNGTSKKTSNFKEMMTHYQKKQSERLFLCILLWIFSGFLWI